MVGTFYCDKMRGVTGTLLEELTATFLCNQFVTIFIVFVTSYTLCFDIMYVEIRNIVGKYV